MYNFSNDEKHKIKLVVRYIATNYEPESKMVELQHARMVKLIKLISYKYGIVGYNYDEVVGIIDDGNIVKVISNDSIYGSKYSTIHELKRYDGADLSKEELDAINSEIVNTEVMRYNEFRSYIHNELKRLEK